MMTLTDYLAVRKAASPSTSWKWFAIIIGITFLCCWRASAGSDCNPVEQCIKEQISQRCWADCLPSREPSEISAQFLVGLLTGTNASLKGNPIRIRHAIVTNDLEFSASEVSDVVSLEDFRFKGAVNFHGSHFKNGLSLAGCVFEVPADFRGLQVDGDFNLRKSAFSNEVSLSFTRVTGNFWAANCIFSQAARFSLLEVALSANIASSHFLGDSYWYGAKAGDKFLGDLATFTGAVNFESIKVGGSASLEYTTFKQAVSFGYAQVTDELSLRGVRFESTNKANFYGMKVGGELKLNESVFQGPAEFGDTVIDKNVLAESASFANTTQMARFNGMKVGGCALFANAKFAGPTSFILAQISGNLDATRATFLNNLSYSDLTNVTSGQLHDSADFGSIHVLGFVVLADVVFTGTVSFRNADVADLHLEKVKWPANKGSVRLDGLTYRHIRGVEPNLPIELARSDKITRVDSKPSWENLKNELLPKAEYSADFYAGLEDYFQRQGAPEVADEVFITKKEFERKHVLHGLHRAWNFFLYGLTAYGRHPELALAWSALVIGIGCFVFRRDNMVPSIRLHAHMKANAAEHAAAHGSEKVAGHHRQHDPIEQAIPTRPKEDPPNAFWYSLDYFLPLFDIKSLEEWQPKPSLLWYASVHKMCGAILIPLGLAALAGVIK